MKAEFKAAAPRFTIPRSPVRLLGLLAASIFVIEVLVMVVLSQLPTTMHGWPEALLDGVVLIVLLFPVLHFLAFQPMLRHIRTREQAEQALQQAHDKLETRVEERTAALVKTNDLLRAEIAERKRVENERAQLIGELQRTLAEVKELSGLLPICADCKKIKDDGGYWNQIEVYVTHHSKAQFSHGLCPDCAKKYYAELESLKL